MNECNFYPAKLIESVKFVRLLTMSIGMSVLLLSFLPLFFPCLAHRLNLQILHIHESIWNIKVQTISLCPLRVCSFERLIADLYFFLPISIPDYCYHYDGTYEKSEKQ